MSSAPNAYTTTSRIKKAMENNKRPCQAHTNKKNRRILSNWLRLQHKSAVLNDTSRHCTTTRTNHTPQQQHNGWSPLEFRWWWLYWLIMTTGRTTTPAQIMLPLPAPMVDTHIPAKQIPMVDTRIPPKQIPMVDTHTPAKQIPMVDTHTHTSQTDTDGGHSHTTQTYTDIDK